MKTLHDHIDNNVKILHQVSALLDDLFILGPEEVYITYIKIRALRVVSTYEAKLADCEDAIELLSCPGHTIIETMEEKGITMDQLQEKVGMNRFNVEKLLDGSQPIDLDIAYRLYLLLGIDVQFWMNRETLYRDSLSKL